MTVRSPLLLALVLLGAPAATSAAEILMVREGTVATDTLETRLEENHALTVWVAAAPRDRRDDLAAASAELSTAREAFRVLAAERALEGVARGVAVVLPHTDLPEGLTLLSELFRLRGRIHLYRDEITAAAEAFGAAADWDPTFSPRVEEWPPEARLAYSDARAARLRSAPGALSARVEPACARIFVDGRARGLGSTSVRALAPGRHVLAAHCPGYERFGVSFDVEGDGALSELSVFLEPVADAPGRRGRALLDQTADAFSQVAIETRFDFLLLVDSDDTLTLRGRDGEAIGGPLNLDDPALATLLEERMTPSGASDDRGERWYASPWVWVVAGAVVAGGATGAILSATSGGDDRLRLVIGR